MQTSSLSLLICYLDNQCLSSQLIVKRAEWTESMICLLDRDAILILMAPRASVPSLP